jgi:acyl-coenzyme A thioesterase PaaI-like protein
VQLSSCFMKPLSGQDALVTARVLRAGKAMAFGEIDPAELLWRARHYSEQMDHATWFVTDGAAVATSPGGSVVRIDSVSCLRGGDFS